MKNEYSAVANTEKQQELSGFSAYWSDFLYNREETAIKIAYECNDGMVTTVVAEFKREV